MGRPATRSEQPTSVVVELETSVGSGEFRVEPRLSVDEVTLESGERFSRARMAARLDAEFGPREARERYHADRRVIIRTDETCTRQPDMLFEGHVHELEWSWDGSQDASARLIVHANHVAERLSSDPSSQVYGREVRSLEIERAVQTDADRSSHCNWRATALPCRFNADGRGNRSTSFLRVVAHTGETLSVPVFVEDDGPGGEQWTYGEILRYLVWFHLPKEGPIGPGNVYEATQYLDQAGASVPFGKALLVCPRDLVCEATNLLEALLLVTSEAGLGFHVETVNENGAARSQLRVWDASSGSVRRLSLGTRVWDASSPPDAPSGSESFDAFLNRNNTHRGSTAWNRATAVTSPILIGGVKHYEIAAELLPGWLPVPELDNVAPGQQAAMKALAMTEEEVRSCGSEAENSQWFRRYHRNGSEFEAYSTVSRKWALNEAGDYDSASYGRGAPFDSYEVFDIASAIGAELTDARKWMRRRRRLAPLPTGEADDSPSRVIVEVSFDSGATWWERTCGVLILPDECGVYFDCVNPTDPAPPGEDRQQQNMWYALIDGAFRVRVRALVESDERVWVRGGVEGSPNGPVISRSRLVYRPDDYAFVRSTDVRIDETQLAQQQADRLAARGGRPSHRPLGAMPWLECDVQIGDRLEGPNGIASGGPTAVILSKRYLLVEGRAETELYGGPLYAGSETG